jgi:hypothetical protein
MLDIPVRLPKAPVVVKVPATLGNVEKSYTAVMVTGIGVGVAADMAGIEPVVKEATMHNAIAAQQVLLCRVTNILFFIFLISFCCFGLP